VQEEEHVHQEKTPESDRHELHNRRRGHADPVRSGVMGGFVSLFPPDVGDEWGGPREKRGPPQEKFFKTARAVFFYSVYKLSSLFTPLDKNAKL